MNPDSGLPPEDDIQQALQQANNPMPENSGQPDAMPGEVLTETHHCPLMGMRYAMAKCGFMAQKYPLQTTLALLLCAGCAWICTYFGATILVGLMLFAIFADD